MWSQITTNSYNFEVVEEFIYLGTVINTNNDVSLEIKHRVTLANRGYFGLNRQLSSKGAKVAGLYKKTKNWFSFANILLVAFEVVPFALNTTICTIKKIIE